MANNGTDALARYQQWTEAGKANQALAREEALAILNGDGIDLMALVQAAGAVRQHHCGDGVTVHVLDNVQNGACPEDCHYCGQSKVSKAPIKAYKIKPVEQIVAEAKEAKEAGAWRFCMALSGRGPDGGEIDHMCEVVKQVSAMGLRTCLSAGLLDRDKAQQLKDAGLDRFNHNLNTSARHYPNICTTHTYEDRLDTLRNLRDAGVGLCSGLIVGMDETYEDLLQAAYQLRELEAESIPVNFLLPIEGNLLAAPTCNGGPLSPQLALRVLCVFRLINPTAEIRVAAGREYHLRSLQAMALWPANSLFVDGYLLTEGSDAEKTFRMILEAGFRVELEEGAWPEHLKRLAAGEPPSAEPTHGHHDATTSVQLKSTVQRQRKKAANFVPSAQLTKPRQGG